VRIEGLLTEQRDLFKDLLRETLHEVLEGEMTELLGAAPGERHPERRGYRAGYYSRGLVTRVGKLELRVPRDRDGRFSTALFERYQRAEKALVSALAEMYVMGCRPARSRRSPRSCVGTASRPRPSVRSTRAWMPPWRVSRSARSPSPIPT
jgi:transposase-like protein